MKINFGFSIVDFGLRKRMERSALGACPESKLQNPKSKMPRRPGFTLTELLIVIAIIAVLASLVTAAAVRAMHAARRAAITLELKQLGGAMENFKNDYGAYPPNGMNPNNAPANGPMAVMLQSDFEGMFKKMFPKSQENPELIRALCGQSRTSAYQNLENGMRASEAIYFWLGGFSDDVLYPISGPRGPSFSLNTNGAGEVIEDRNRKYDFDLSRLRPVDDDGVFAGRAITYPDPKGGANRQINFWRYHPKSSEQAIIYFDVSRHKPGAFGAVNRYDCWAARPEPGIPPIYAIKELRKGVNVVGANFKNVIFAQQGKFQILHAGLDDEWGDEFAWTGVVDDTGALKSTSDPFVYYPDGPFTKALADTLTSFTDATLEDAQEKK